MTLESDAWDAGPFTRAAASAGTAAETTVVTGQGLGPDLRVAVPFVMARRSGPAARFVALYDAGGDGPAVSVVESRPGVFTVTRGAVRDEITLAPRFSFVRTGGKP